MLAMDAPGGGWTICPICGAVIADTWAHANWHDETTLADVITDSIETAITAESPTEDQEDTE